MKEIGAVYIDINRVIAANGCRVDVILNGCDSVIHEQLVTVQVAGKAAHTVVHGDDVGIERTDEIIERRQRRNLPAGCNINIHTEGCKAGFRVILRISMHRYMAFIKVCNLCVSGNRTLCNEQRNRSALRLVVLLCDIEHRCANHIRECGEEGGQTL